MTQVSEYCDKTQEIERCIRDGYYGNAQRLLDEAKGDAVRVFADPSFALRQLNYQQRRLNDIRTS